MKISKTITVLALSFGGALMSTVHGAGGVDTKPFLADAGGLDEESQDCHLSDMASLSGAGNIMDDAGDDKGAGFGRLLEDATPSFSRGDIIDAGVDSKHLTGLVFEDDRPGRRMADDVSSLLRGTDRNLQTEGEIAVCCVYPLHNLLVSKGKSSTFVPKSAILNGALLNGDGTPKYKVLVLTRFGIEPMNAPTQAFLDELADYVAAGGNVVTEYDGGVVFFSELADRPMYRYYNTRQLGLFEGKIFAGYSHGYDTPINNVAPFHPTMWGVDPTFSQDNGTEFFFWVQDPDPALTVVATFDGLGSPAFPNNETLHTGLTGCIGNATFVFGFWDYQDKFTNGPNERFFLNAVEYAMDAFSCIVTSSPSSAPTEVLSNRPSQHPSEMPSQNPSSAPSLTPSLDPSEAPSQHPSSEPSEMPSKYPSSAPSLTPSTTPSRMPSPSPSGIPSSNPSPFPTLLPSSHPSPSPTADPSGMPSPSPSMTPSLDPSPSPSSQPSPSPSSYPTWSSARPSVEASSSPTWSSARPSVESSSSPTWSSARPTAQASSNPTWSSDAPSVQASSNPTWSSAAPTTLASDSPSVSAAPSASPSVSPTGTVAPSASPSVSPTGTYEPSASPSCVDLEIEPLSPQVVFVEGAPGAPVDNGQLEVIVLSGDALSYSWKTTCENATFSDPTIANPILSVSNVTEDEMCEVSVTVWGPCRQAETTNGTIIVVDPSGGFATGGGHIDSPPGAYPNNSSLTGHGQYCFIIKYKPGKSEPSGAANFKFNGIDLSSTSYDWLVVTDDFCATFQGQAIVSGNPGYAFVITACDYGLKMGSFLIQIWNTTDDMILYDNHFDGTMIAGGDIRVNL